MAEISRGTDIHQRASFIASLIELSFVRSELSTHAAADLDDQTADNGGVDLDLEVDVLASPSRTLKVHS